MSESEILSPTQAEIQRVLDRFWEAVPPTWHYVREQLRRTAAEQFGVTVEQYHILRHVWKGAAASVSELAELRQISRSAVSQLVDVLVEKGLMERTPLAEDRRCVRLSLTATGDALIRGIFQQNRAWMGAKLAGFSPAELEALERGLELLKEIKDLP